VEEEIDSCKGMGELHQGLSEVAGLFVGPGPRSLVDDKAAIHLISEVERPVCISTVVNLWRLAH